MIALALFACGQDADFDGFAAADDCDDADAFVYPGAPEISGNGLDEDCDGADRPFAILGEWQVTRFEADYSGFLLFIPGTGEGLLAVGDDLAATLDVTATLDPAVAGVPFPLNFVMDGAASPIPGPDTFVLYAETVLYDEAMHVDLDCAVLGDQMSCVGEIKALSIGFLAIAELERTAQSE